MAPPSTSPDKSTTSHLSSHLPIEILNVILDQIPRHDLLQARYISKAFAIAASPRLFETIPLWLSQYSLQALTGLSQHPQLRLYVKEIVFSPLSFIDAEHEDVYLSSLEYARHFSMFKQFESAYRLYRESQRQLIADGLGESILASAFTQFPNLKSLVLDNRNRLIGAKRLSRDLVLCAGHCNAIISQGWGNSCTCSPTILLTYQGIHSLPILVRALSSAGVSIENFTIGWHYSFQCFLEGNTNSCLSVQYTESCFSRALFESVCSEENRDCAKKTLHNLHSFKFEATGLGGEGRRGWWRQLCSALKAILGSSSQLQYIDISPEFQGTRMQELFGLYHGTSLRHLKINTMEMEPQSLAEFLRRQASTLQILQFVYAELVGGAWSDILVDLKSINFPALETFELAFCRDPVVPKHFHNRSVKVQDFILGKTTKVPMTIPA